jgi:hypothetical protein
MTDELPQRRSPGDYIDSPRESVGAIFAGAITLVALVMVVMLWRSSTQEQPGNLINAVGAAANIAFVVFNFHILRTAQRQLRDARVEATSAAEQWRSDHEISVDQVHQVEGAQSVA